MNPFRVDLQDLLARHIAQAPAPRLLRLVEALDSEEAPLAFGKSVALPRFTLLGPDGRVLLDPQDGEHVATYDAQTNLTWLAAPVDCGEVPWEEAVRKVSEVRLFGLTDWRAPTIHELLSIVDYERCDPAVDQAAFKGPYGWTWTSTKAAAPAGYAWGVFLSVGGARRHLQSGLLQVRAVRSGQPLALGL